ncbi:hypothetical protein GCM10028771_23350 [Nocardioides marmoraquaticus]
MPLKYAVVERERRFLVSSVPDGVTATRRIVDRYVDRSRLRLREVHETGRPVVRKLTQKVRVDGTAAAVACTNVYLDEREWSLLVDLPARTLRKTRYVVERDGWRIAVDELLDGILLAEIDDGDRTPRPVPEWLDVLLDVSADERWTGVALAGA